MIQVARLDPQTLVFQVLQVALAVLVVPVHHNNLSVTRAYVSVLITVMQLRTDSMIFLHRVYKSTFIKNMSAA